MLEKSFPLRKVNKVVFTILGVLCCLLIVAIPAGILVFLQLGRSKLKLEQDTIVYRWIWSEKRILFLDIEKAQWAVQTTNAGGLLGGLISAGLGRPLMITTKQGKKIRMLVEAFEGGNEVVQEIQKKTPLTIS